MKPRVVALAGVYLTNTKGQSENHSFRLGCKVSNAMS